MTTTERIWRHLNIVSATLSMHRDPTVPLGPADPTGSPQPWAEPGSRFTLAFEHQVIDALKGSDITASVVCLHSGWKEMLEKLWNTR